MRYYILFFIVFFLLSCSENNKFVKNNKQLKFKALELALLSDDNKNNEKFKDNTEYKIYFLNWNEIVSLECKDTFFKDKCKNDYQDNWNKYFYKKLESTEKKIWYLKFITNHGKYKIVKVFFIDSNSRQILVKYTEKILNGDK